MNNHLKTICLILITLAVLIGVSFYVWDVVEKQAYFEKQDSMTPSKWREQF